MLPVWIQPIVIEPADLKNFWIPVLGMAGHHDRYAPNADPLECQARSHVLITKESMT